MQYLPFIVATLLTVTPVTDTGTGTAYEYIPPYTEAEEAESTVSQETAAIETDGYFEKEEKTTRYSVNSEPIKVEQAAEAPLPENMDEAGYFQYVTWREIEMLAYLVDKEAGLAPCDGGSLRDAERAAVVWCVLNRMDKGSRGGFRDSVTGVLTQSGQFRSYYGTGSRANIDLVIDTLTLWTAEKRSGYPIDGRSLGRDFCWYYGNGSRNFFRDGYKAPYTIWDWRWG